MSKQTKKVTLEALAATMDAGFKRMDKGFKDAKEDNESLARMVANGFEHTATKDDVITLQNDVSDIKLRVDSLAPYFEVKHLERRVKRLEDRAGIRNTIQH